MSFFDTPISDLGSSASTDRRARQASERRSFARRQQLRNFFYARVCWSDEEIEEENLRLEAEIEARIVAGEVTVLPPATYSPPES
jgi:hypothetical protein